MYITYNSKDYTCKSCRIGKDTKTYTGLPDDFPTEVSGEIVLKADDGFILRTDNVEDYSRQIFENGTLTLTNIPEAEPIPEPEYPEITEITTEDMANAILEGVNDI